ncbi:DUF7009 family protein [Spongiivirga citrea]|uniref:Uncharacterized protein n=1 Tax=Spongiivirga citrea TaxID=1481457 RepID=A0A6M0CEP9_9FLAO|nr:hypothetical protein [Spongiivirga citrea]NER16296.1 hypothetical protein [Spongiivirga citrea]
MKIRIKGNSIRYRLTKSEVKTFCETGKVMQQAHFDSQTFTYSLEAKEEDFILNADFQSNTITLYLNKTNSEDWFDNDQVGFSQTIITSNGNELALLVEKDLVCMDSRDEDQSDNYPNPKLAN